MGPHIVIIGAGFAGISAAIRLRSLATRKRCRVTIISDKPYFLFIPSLPWFVVGQAKERDIIKPLEQTKIAKFSEIVIASALTVVPDRQVVQTTVGTIPYDMLIIAAGCVHDGSTIPGYESYAWSLEPFWQSQQLRRRLESASVKRVVVTTHSASPCQFGQYEVAFLLARQGRQVQLVTSALDLSVVGDPHLHRAWATAARRLGLNFHTGRNVAEILPDGVVLDDGTRLDCDLAIVAPAPRAPEFTMSLAPAITRTGLLLTDNTLKSTGWDTIYGAGNIVSLLPPVIASTAEMTGNIAAHNVAVALGLERGTPRSFRPDLLLLHETGRGWGITGFYHPAPGYGLSRRRLFAGWPIGLAKMPFRWLWMAARL